MAVYNNRKELSQSKTFGLRNSSREKRMVIHKK